MNQLYLGMGIQALIVASLIPTGIISCGGQITAAILFFVLAYFIPKPEQ